MKRSSLQGSLRAPPSKSATHRALFCAALADGQSRIQSALRCGDTLATAEALSKLGVSTSWNEENAHVAAEGLKKPSSQINCRESGTTLRFVTAVCATTPYDADITSESSLLMRPISDLALALRELGADCNATRGCPPVHVKGPLQGGSAEIPGTTSSQYVSALLLAAPLAKTPVEINVSGGLESKNYVKMTLDMQQQFGVEVEEENLTRFHCERQPYRPSSVEIEGDWSSAAFLLLAATIAGEEIRVLGLSEGTLQADQSLLSILGEMGGRVMVDSDSVGAEKSDLHAIDVDVSECPDLFPVACALCAVADGVSNITGLRRLRIKESDRVLAMSEGLKQMGIKTHASRNSFTIYGGKPHGAVINPHRDHRIAMAFATLGLCADQAEIVDAECVQKSYPSFWFDMQHLGADVTEN